MLKSIDQIVQDTLDAFNSEFQPIDIANITPEALVKLKENALGKMNEFFDNAFEQAEGESKQKKLRFALSREFHPDHFKQKHPSLAVYFEQLGLYHLPSAKVNAVKESIDDQSAVLEAICNHVMKVLTDMSLESLRYPEPISTLVNAVSWIINLLLIVPAIGVGVSGVSLFFIISGIKNLPLLLVNGLSEKQYKDVDELLSHLNYAIKQPLPEGKVGEVVFALLTKLGQVVSFPLLSVSNFVFEWSSLGTGILTIGTIGFLAGVKAATLAILNAPLHLYDAFRNFTGKDQERPSVEEKPENGAPDDNSSKQLALLGGPQALVQKNIPVDNHEPLFLADKKALPVATNPENDSHLQLD